MKWLKAYFREVGDIYGTAFKRDMKSLSLPWLQWNSVMLSNTFVLYTAPIPPLARWFERKFFSEEKKA